MKYQLVFYTCTTQFLRGSVVTVVLEMFIFDNLAQNTRSHGIQNTILAPRPVSHSQVWTFDL